MDLANQLILVGASLLLLSIFAGLISSRIGAPLLLVFLALGMLAGEDGPGGIEFDDFRAAYLIGSVALAIILFDGGLRTKRSSFRLAVWPSLLLATVGVVATAVVTAVAAAWALGLGWLPALLVGSVVASTDAAAVFFLLHLHGMSLQQRVSATLEIESGMNDPMAVFLTITCVELLLAGAPSPDWGVALNFSIQMGGGLAIGVLGGYLLLWLVNRLVIAPGLYPILAVSVALFLFAAAQTVGASGFLAVYLVGLVLGNHRHRATQVIDRFHDGLAWLSQIVMFLMLGLLVTPSSLLAHIGAALLIAAVLMLAARPLAVLLCVLPFRYSWRETVFISWVGLRGAVPIFLASVPVMAGVPGARVIFDVAFVVVLVSLVLQGWTVAVTARWLGLDLPPTAEPLGRTEIDLPRAFDRDVTGYVVGSRSRATGHGFAAIPLPRRARIISVIRDGVVMDRSTLDHLEPGDYALIVAPPGEQAMLDRLFAARPASGRAESGILGEFAFDAALPAKAVADLYGLALEPAEAELPLGALLLRRLGRMPVVGDRVRVGPVELIVRELDGDRLVSVGVELEPHEPRWRDLGPRALAKRLLHRFRRSLRP